MIKKDNVIIIKAQQDLWASLSEVFNSREVLYMLALRDILVRFKQTALGVTWSLLRPLLTMLVFVMVFGKVAHLPSEGIPYPLLVLAALLPWMFFAHTVSVGSSVLVDNAPMLRRTYFPRMILPMASIGVHLCDFVMSLLVYLGISFYYHFSLDAKILLIPFLILHLILLTCGITFILSALAVRIKDVVYVLPFLIQIGFFVTPIGYTTSLIPHGLRFIFYLNPMVGLIEIFRWVLLAGKIAVHWESYILSLSVSIILFIIGTIFFVHYERKVADIL